MCLRRALSSFRPCKGVGKNLTTKYEAVSSAKTAAVQRNEVPLPGWPFLLRFSQLGPLHRFHPDLTSASEPSATPLPSSLSESPFAIGLLNAALSCIPASNKT